MTLLRYETAVTSLVGFPWKSLPTFGSDELRVETQARRALLDLVDFAALRDVMSSLFVASLDEMMVCSTRVTSERRDLGTRFTLRHEGLTVWLSVEPALVMMLLKRVLGQRDGLDAGAPLSESLTGAALAVVAEVNRRLARGPGLRLDFSLQQAPAGKHELVAFPGERSAWVVDFRLRVDGRTFFGFAAVSGALDWPRRVWPTRSPAFGTLVTLNVVVAECELERADFESLMLGDVVMPGSPTLDVFASKSHELNLPNGTTVTLCSPGAAVGLKLEVRAAKLCLAGTTQLCYDRPVTINPAVKDPSAASESGGTPTALDVVMEAPVVVHIEIGTVTLPAHQWLGLRLGDVVTSQLPIGRPVTLRVAAQAVAEGELVSVDGHVGVRILRFHGA